MSKTAFYGDVLFTNDCKLYLLTPSERSAKNFYLSQPLIVRLKSKVGDSVVSDIG